MSPRSHARGEFRGFPGVHVAAPTGPYHPPTMFQTRTALVRRLQALESGLEARIEQNPDTADPWPEFDAQASAIRKSAGADDRGYVSQRISCILARHGLIPSDDAFRRGPCLPTDAHSPGARP